MRAWVWIWSGVATAALLSAADVRPVEATYELARAEGTRCATCHVSVRPNAGTLNETGRYYQQRRSLKGAPGVVAAPVAEAGSPGDAGAPAGPRTGAQIFAEVCASCHGARGEGTTLAPPFRKPGPDGVPRPELTRVVRDGVEDTAMMGFAGLLAEDELEAVVEHVAALTKTR